MKLTTTLIVTALLSGICRAQTPCHAEFDGNVFWDKTSMGGPNFTNCFKTSTSKALVVFAVQVRRPLPAIFTNGLGITIQ